MTEAALPADVVTRVGRDYDEVDRAAVILALGELSSATREHARVARCVLYVAAGDLQEFGRVIALAHTDFRDVIVAAEYDRDLRRLRDLSQPFADP